MAGVYVMKKFHVLLIGECGEDFSVEVLAKDKDEAWDMVSEDYPESRVDYVRELSRYERGL
jgi:hypothetical protein